jgi:hypothetical protein
VRTEFDALLARNPSFARPAIHDGWRATEARKCPNPDRPSISPLATLVGLLSDLSPAIFAMSALRTPLKCSVRTAWESLVRIVWESLGVTAIDHAWLGHSRL